MLAVLRRLPALRASSISAAARASCCGACWTISSSRRSSAWTCPDRVARYRPNRACKLDRLRRAQRERIRLLHGSLMYRDTPAHRIRRRRRRGSDRASRPAAAARHSSACCSSSARPGTIALTTPNAEYNVKWPIAAGGTVPASRPPLRVDACRSSRPGPNGVAARFGYDVALRPIGPRRQPRSARRRRWRCSRVCARVADDQG